MTTTTSTDQHRAELRTRALNALDSLDGNGVDFLVLGVAAHLALRITHGEQPTVEALSEELDGDIDTVNELLDTGYFTLADGGVLQLTHFDSNGVEIEPNAVSR